MNIRSHQAVYKHFIGWLAIERIVYKLLDGIPSEGKVTKYASN